MTPPPSAATHCALGFVTSTADADAGEAAIMEEIGHRSTTQLRDYMRDGRLFHNNVAAVTGL